MPQQLAEFNPADLAPIERYKLLVGCVTPRPIAWVSTRAPDGSVNLAPYSFFNAIGADPMTVLFCPATQPDGSEKDSLRNAKLKAEGGSGEFVVNVASESMIRHVAATGEELPHGESEFELAGLTEAPCAIVSAPRVAESPVAFECRTLEVVRTNGLKPGSGNVVIGEVVYAHVDRALIDERLHVNADSLATIGRMGGADYCRTRDRFALPRGRAALDPGEGNG